MSYTSDQATRLYNQQRSLITQAVIQEGYAARSSGIQKAAYLNRARRYRQDAAALEPAREAAMLAAKAEAVAAADAAKTQLDLRRARAAAAAAAASLEAATLAASTAVSSSGPTPDLQTVINQQNGTGLPTLPDENPLSNLRPPANVSVSLNPNVKIGLAVVGIVGAALVARKVMS